MPFPKDCYGPETLGLMTQAFDAAWEEAEYALASNTFDPTGLRRLMALKIMAAVREQRGTRLPRDRVHDRHRTANHPSAARADQRVHRRALARGAHQRDDRSRPPGGLAQVA